MTATWREEPWLVARAADGEADTSTLARPWECTLNALRLRLRIPAGFIHDGPSIPAGLHWLLPVTGASRVPALVHDALYAIRGGEWPHGKLLVTRERADDLFRDMLRAAPIARWRVWAMHRGVRWFGNPPVFGAWRTVSAGDRENERNGTLPQLIPMIP